MTAAEERPARMGPGCLMSSTRSRRGVSLRVRLQFILLLMIAWDGLGLVSELTFGSPLFKISGSEIGGVLAAHGSFGFALGVPLTLYAYALIRGPLRYRGLLWIGVLEQGLVALSAVYHGAVKDIKVEGLILPLIVSLFLVVLLLTNMPRGAVESE